MLRISWDSLFKDRGKKWAPGYDQASGLIFFFSVYTGAGARVAFSWLLLAQPQVPRPRVGQRAAQLPPPPLLISRRGWWCGHPGTGAPTLPAYPALGSSPLRSSYKNKIKIIKNNIMSNISVINTVAEPKLFTFKIRIKPNFIPQLVSYCCEKYLKNSRKKFSLILGL